MKIRPFDFPEPEAVAAPIENNLPAQALPSIIRGSSLFDDLTGVAGGLPTPTEQTAFKISAVYACVNIIAGAIAALPLSIYSRKPDGERDVRPLDQLWFTLNEQMTPRWSAASGWEFIVQAKLIHGDGFAKIHRDRLGQVTGIEPVHPRRVYVLVTPDAQRLVYVISPDPLLPVTDQQPGVEVLDQDDVLHFAGFGFDGRRGLSPLRYSLQMAGAVALGAQEYSARWFANGARPDYALQTDNNLAPEKIEQLRNQLDERHRGPTNAARPMVLTGGLKVEPISMPAEDMQLISTRQFQIEEIARIYGVPPFMIGHNEKTTSWGSGVESMGIGFVRYTLRQHLNKIATELNRKIFRTAAKLVEFDTTDLERADTASLFAALRTAVGQPGAPGIMTVNEARGRLNLKKVPGGDTLFNGAADAPAAPAEPAQG